MYKKILIKNRNLLIPLRIYSENKNNITYFHIVYVSEAVPGEAGASPQTASTDYKIIIGI